MARTEQEDFQLYFSRVRPIYHQLFNLAHAVTGSSDQAAYCVQYAMLDCWAAGDASASRHGFREGLRSSTLDVALRIAGTEGAEFDWAGLAADEDERDPLLRLLRQERPEFQRMLALRCGCGLSPRRIARLLNCDVTRVRGFLRRFDARVRRGIGGSNRARSDAALARAVRGRMTQPSPLAPDMGGVFRGFQSDAAAISRPSRLPARILRGIFTVAFALLCIVAFWLAAVLMQPVMIEEPTEQFEGPTEQFEEPTEQFGELALTWSVSSESSPWPNIL